MGKPLFERKGGGDGREREIVDERILAVTM